MSARKVSKEIEDQLIAHYVLHGSKASAAVCIAAGVGPRYAASLASVYGKRCKKPRPSKNKPRPTARFTHDPKWQWAIARGPVIA